MILESTNIAKNIFLTYIMKCDNIKVPVKYYNKIASNFQGGDIKKISLRIYSLS